MLAQIEARGSPFDVGAALGRHAARAIHEQVRALPEFRRLLPWRDDPRLRALEATARHWAPAYLAEVEGLAAGAEWPFAEAWLWNCKGDLRAAGDPPGRGCTTLLSVNTDGGLIAHNEDGAPAHRDDGFVVRCSPDYGVGFWSFCYPGLICGNSFAVNDRCLVQTLNNVRALDGRAGVPRQLVARAILDSHDLDEALNLLRTWPRASGYHHALAQAGDPRVFAVEAPASGVAVRSVERRLAHANHLIEPAFAQVPQIVTASSAARQARATASFVDARGDALGVLLDGSGERPVHCRGGADDDSWTLATAVFAIDRTGVKLAVHQGSPTAVLEIEVLA